MLNTLEDYSKKLKEVETLNEKLKVYQLLNWELGLMPDEEIDLKWLQLNDNCEEILIDLKSPYDETALLTVEYDGTHLLRNIKDVKLELFVELKA